MLITPLLSFADPSYLQRKMYWVISAYGKPYAPCRRTHAFSVRILCCNFVISLGCITYIRSPSLSGTHYRTSYIVYQAEQKLKPKDSV
jgi:hypothetical protein